MDDLDLAYAAGFFDGEGSIIIRTHNRKSGNCRSPVYDLQVQVGNTDPRVVLWLHEHFAGHLYTGRPGGNKRNYLSWTVTGHQAVAFLIAIKPFVRMKREQIDIGLAFQKTKKTRGPNVITTEELTWREAQKLRIQALNKAEWVQ